jgi:hypothetical protein
MEMKSSKNKVPPEIPEVYPGSERENENRRDIMFSDMIGWLLLAGVIVALIMAIVQGQFCRPIIVQDIVQSNMTDPMFKTMFNLTGGV